LEAKLIDGVITLLPIAVEERLGTLHRKKRVSVARPKKFIAEQLMLALQYPDPSQLEFELGIPAEWRVLGLPYSSLKSPLLTGKCSN